MIQRLAATGLAALALNASAAYGQAQQKPTTVPKPVIVHLRWMHGIEGMSPELARKAQASNTQLAATYDSLVKTLGPGPLYVNGLLDDNEFQQAVVAHKLDHKYNLRAARTIDSLTAVDGPLMMRAIEGTLPVRAAETNEAMALFDLAESELPPNRLRPYVEALEDDLLNRITREKPRVAYVLLGCTHDLTDAAQRAGNTYRVLTVSTPTVRAEPKCNPAIFGPNRTR